MSNHVIVRILRACLRARFEGDCLRAVWLGLVRFESAFEALYTAFLTSLVF